MDSNRKAIDDFKRATERLDEAIAKTVLAWPHIPRCWIDMISEPTITLEKHKVKPNGENGH